MHVEYVANGMGAQSMYLLYLASQKKIPATISITANTGWENDCDLFDGTKTTAREFFEKHLKPLADSWGIDAYFVRALDKSGKEMPPLGEKLAEMALQGKTNGVPVYSSEGGRQIQSCTDKWKIRAMKQQARRLGATTARSAQGIHYGERARRVKGVYLGEENGFSIYRTAVMDKKTGKMKETKWLSHYYPLVDLRMDREAVRAEVEKLGLPYLLSSECQGCPHADPWRWLRRTPETIERIAQIEEAWNGEHFFTDRRRPLREVIAEYKEEARLQPNMFDTANFGCEGGICGV